MSAPVRIVTYNIQYSRGKDGEFDLARIADTVRSADIIGLQEVTRHLPPAPDDDQPAVLEGLLGEFYCVYGAPADMDASTVGDNGVVLNRRRQFGNMLFSRWPIASMRLQLFPRIRTFDVLSLQRGALEAVIDHPDGPLRVYVVHLEHLLERRRVEEVGHLLDFAFAAERHGTAATGPARIMGRSPAVPAEFIVLGDCNMLPGSPAYIRMTGAPDYYYGPTMTSDHLVDTWPLVGREITDGITWWDESTNFESGTRLDYLFVTPGLADAVVAAGIDEQAAGSDHQPVWIDLDVSRLSAP
ncbi:MAG: endonuclease/exonuclease/phosphatase family protein [Ilumatobacteraceae bacterium]